MTDKQLCELLGDKFVLALRTASDYYFLTRPRYDQLYTRNERVSRAWGVIDEVLERLWSVRPEDMSFDL